MSILWTFLWTYLINFQNTTDYFQKCFFLLYSNLIYINLHMGWLGDNQSASSSRNFPEIFPQDFPEMDPDWLAPHHSIPNTKFPPITAFLKLAFFPSSLSCKSFPQDFPTRFSHKIFPKEFPTRFSHKIFPKWNLIGWLPITLFQILNFHQSLPFLNWLFPLLPVPENFPTRFSCKIFPQEFPTRFSRTGSWLVGSPSPYSKC